MAEADISEEELRAMEARIEATTSGPWIPMFEGRDHQGGESFIRTGGQDIYIAAEDYKGGGGHFCADLDFIAHARQDMTRLVAEVRRLQQILGKRT